MSGEVQDQRLDKMLSTAEADAVTLASLRKSLTKNQLRAMYGHLKTLEQITNDARFKVEAKLFLARIFYKTERGSSAIDKEIYVFFKDKLMPGNDVISLDEYKNVFIKYLESVVAYFYGHSKKR